MGSTLVRFFVTLAAFGGAGIILCCSSSEGGDAPAAPVEAGPGSDAPSAVDASDGALPTSSADYKSGTRLRANVLTADGVSLWTAWKDTKLGVDCELEVAEDKKLRCIPTAETLDGVTFSDINCMMPVHRGRPGCATPTLVRAFPKTCGEGMKVYRLGAVVDTTVVYEKNGANCAQITVSGFDVYPVASTVAPSELVAATAKQVDAGDGLAKTVFEAEDGASQIASLYDVGRKTRCERGGGSKDDRCVPKDLGFEERIYSDIGCAMPAAYHPAYSENCAGPPAIILKEGVPGMCGAYEAEYVAPGALVTMRPLFRKGVGSCDDANITAAETGTYWAFGAAVPQTSLPALANLDEGAARIKLRVDATPSGARLRGRAFFDSERKEPCNVATGSDGVERCFPVPNGGTQVTEFSDDKCEKPLAHVETGCAPSTFVEIVGSGPSTCSMPPKTRFFKVGAKITPAQVFVQLSSTVGSEAWNSRDLKSRPH